MTRGKFIVLEGLDGSGTTTQMKLLENYLKKNKISIWCTCEPTDSPIGKLLRDYLGKKLDLSNTTPETFMYLYAADRSIHCQQIEKALNEGTWVICDRYVYSSYAYQGKDIKGNILYDINEPFLKPDNIFYINTPINECINRIESRGLKKELYEEENILKSVFRGYMKCFDKIDDNISIIDGTKLPEEISKDILKILNI